MTQKGFVYILTNKSMPNTVKVGKTTKVPTSRAQELASTGVPTPFVVEYYAFFDDMDSAERIAHQKLSNNHHGKEFFAVDVATAIVAIESTGVPFQKLFSNFEQDSKADELRYDLEQKLADRRLKDKADEERREFVRLECLRQRQEEAQRQANDPQAREASERWERKQELLRQEYIEMHHREYDEIETRRKAEALQKAEAQIKLDEQWRAQHKKKL